MIWIIRLYLLIMIVIYGVIGLWAILDPIIIAHDLDYPSLLNIVGLAVTAPIGYSEFAGIYGGLNLCIGFMCVIGIFKENIATFSIKFITFLVGSIALGRVLFSMMPSTPSFYNVYFIFEVCTFLVGIFLLYQQRQLN